MGGLPQAKTFLPLLFLGMLVLATATFAQRGSWTMKAAMIHPSGGGVHQLEGKIYAVLPCGIVDRYDPAAVGNFFKGLALGILGLLVWIVASVLVAAATVVEYAAEGPEDMSRAPVGFVILMWGG